MFSNQQDGTENKEVRTVSEQYYWGHVYNLYIRNICALSVVCFLREEDGHIS